MAVMQATVDPAMQGRVFTLLSSAATAMMPLGLALAGPLADVIGVRTWFLIGGLVTLAIGVSGFFFRSLATLEREGGQHPAASAPPTLPLATPAD